MTNISSTARLSFLNSSSVLRSTQDKPSEGSMIDEMTNLLRPNKPITLGS
jgi:hypothetical protein